MQLPFRFDLTASHSLKLHIGDSRGCKQYCYQGFPDTQGAYLVRSKKKESYKDVEVKYSSSGETVFYLPSGIHHRHFFCSDLVRQTVKIQQHDEGSASQQQHGWEDLDPRHFLPQFKEGRRPLDHHAKSHASNLE